MRDNIAKNELARGLSRLVKECHLADQKVDKALPTREKGNNLNVEGIIPV